MMQTFRNDDTDQDVLFDLLEEINELYEASEQTLIALDHQPGDQELLRDLFRSVHTIKGDLGLVNFKPLLPLMQRVEDLLDFLRRKEVVYTPTMSDLVLLSLDRVKLFVESCVHQGGAEYDGQLLELVEKQIQRISPQNPDLHEKLLQEAVLLLNPALDRPPEDDNATPVTAPKQTTAPVESPQPRVFLHDLGFTDSLDAKQEADLRFFRELMGPVEQRSAYMEGRCDRIAKLVLFLNRLAKNPVEPLQLAVACYVHDFGMAFMPLSILHKTESLSEAEFNLLRSHVFKSAKLLEHLSEYNEARKIVMQNHERTDGSGYPMGLKGKDICEGAKLLSIVDTFDALTHPRNYDAARPISKKKAVIEMNRVAEGQFDSAWMKIFNAAMQKLLNR